jgi:hypothetical protein
VVAFNPDIPETQEPNYLRYSRPSNYAPINRGTGEAIKGISQVVGQTARAADSVVTEGIKSYVGNQAQEYQEQHIAGLQDKLQSLTSPQTNTPKDIQNLPGKVDSLSAYRDKGSQVTADYDAKLYSLAKDMRNRFPGYRDIIDREINRATGMGMANPLARNLQASINAIEGKIDSEQKRKENIVDTYTKEGNISPVMRAAYDQGHLSADYLINKGTAVAYQHRNMQLIEQRNNTEMSGYKLNSTRAEHDASNVRDIIASRIMTDASIVQGTETTPKFLQFKADLESGKRPYLTPEAQKQLTDSHDAAEQRFLSQLHGYMTTSGLAEKMGPEAYSRVMKEAKESWGYYTGLGDAKNYAQQHSFQKWMEAKTESEQMARELSTTGQMLRRGAATIKMGGNQPWIERQVNDHWADSKNGIDVGSLLTDHFYGAITRIPGKEGGPPPSVHTTINDLNRLGFKGSPIGIATAWSDHIANPSVPDDAKRALIDYYMAGDGAKLIPQLAKESPLPRPGIDYTISAEGRPITKGRYSYWDSMTKPEVIDSAYKLGGQSWQTVKDYVTSSTRTMLGSEIPDLNKYAEQGYQFSWNSKNSTLSIAEGQGQVNLDTGEVTPNRISNAMRREVDNVNRILKGIKNVAIKEPNIDVNAYLLKALQEGGLGDNEVVQAIQRAIISSHKSSALQPQGQTMSDVGDQMGMGATAMNIQPKQPIFGVPLGETLPAIRPGAAKPATTSQGFVAPGPGTRNIEVPAELGRGGGDYLGRPNMSTIERTPIQPGVPMTRELARSQKNLDRTLARGQEDAARATQAGEASITKEEAKAAEMHKRSQENIDALSHSTAQLMEKFKGHGREEEFLGNRLEGLKRVVANYGEGPAKKGLQSELRMVQKRLKEIKLEQNPMSEPIYKAP